MPRRVSLPKLPQRVLAGLGAVLVLGLTLLAASPVAHGWLHTGTSDPCAEHTKTAPVPVTGDQGCVVVLFASAVDTPVAAVEVVPPHEVVTALPPAIAADVDVTSPRYLRLPERGPPLVRIA